MITVARLLSRSGNTGSPLFFFFPFGARLASFFAVHGLSWSRRLITLVRSVCSFFSATGNADSFLTAFGSGLLLRPPQDPEHPPGGSSENYGSLFVPSVEPASVGTTRIPL